MKKIIIPIIFLIMMSSIALGISSWQGLGGTGVTQLTHEITVSNGKFENTGNLSSCSIVHGLQTGTEPLVYDFDQDGDRDLFLPSIDDDYLRFYDSDCVLLKEKSVSTIDGQACMFTQNNEWNTLPTIFMKIGYNFTAFVFNGTNILITDSFWINYTLIDGIKTNVTKPFMSCSSLKNNLDAVYYVDDYNRIVSFDSGSKWNNTWNISMESPSGTVGTYYSGTYHNNTDYLSTTTCVDCKSPVYIVDLDRDGISYDLIWRYKDFVFSHDGGNSFINNLTGACDYELGTFIPYLVIERKSVGAEYSVFIANDGKRTHAGDERCIVQDDSDWGCLRRIDSSGVSSWTKNYFNYMTIFSGGFEELREAKVSSFGSNYNTEERIWTIGGGNGDTICPYSGVTARYVCSYLEWDYDGNLELTNTSIEDGVSCGGIPSSNGYKVNDFYYDSGQGIDFGLFSIGGSFEEDGFIIGDGYPLEFNGSTTTKVIDFSYGYSITVDVDFDNLDEVVNYNSVALKIYQSNYINTPPVTDNAIGDTCTPICVGETVSLDVGYTDDDLNPVYSAVDCFDTGDWSDWSSISYNPTVSCVMNTSSGSHTMNIRTTDSTNFGNTSTYSVIDLDYTVALANCYDGGEIDDVCTPLGGTAGSGSAGHNATDYGLYVNGTDDNTSIDGYSPRNIDWSGCEDWVILYSLCPVWTMYTVGIGDFVKWIVGGIMIAIATVLLYVFFIYKNKNK